jgi:hypothetical protein
VQHCHRTLLLEWLNAAFLSFFCGGLISCPLLTCCVLVWADAAVGLKVSLMANFFLPYVSSFVLFNPWLMRH